MLDTSFIIEYLRRQLAIADPSLEKDPAYIFTDEQLTNIIKVCIPKRNPKYTIENFPVEENYLLVSLAKIEVLWSLATSSAEYYPISAEGAELKKDKRFDHYYKLIKLAQDEYYLSKREWDRENPQGIAQGILFSDSRHFDVRQRQQQRLPRVTISEIKSTETEIFLDWTKFEGVGAIYLSYKIYFGSEPVFDEYEGTFLKDSFVKEIYDINRLKYKFSNLKSNTEYFVAVVAVDVNGLSGVCTSSIKTKEVISNAEVGNR